MAGILTIHLPAEDQLFTISNGEFTYIDQKPHKPLTVSNIFAEANNIRNVYSVKGIYPSPVVLSAKVFDRGKLERLLGLA